MLGVCMWRLVNKLSVLNAQSKVFNTDMVLFLLETMLMLESVHVETGQQTVSLECTE